MFTTIGITALDLLLATDEQLQKFYRLLGNLSRKDIDVLISTLSGNKQALLEMQYKIDTESEEYADLVESIGDFERDYLTPVKDGRTLKGSSGGTGVETTSVFTDFFDDVLDALDNLESETEVDALQLIKSSEWRSRVKKSEDISIVENHEKSLQDKFLSLPIRIEETNLPANADIKSHVEHIIKTLKTRISQTDEIIAEMYNHSGRVSEVLNVPVYKDYYYSRKNIYRLITDTYSNASSSKFDESIRDINSFISQEARVYNQVDNPELIEAIDKYCTTKEAYSGANIIKTNNALMNVLSEFFNLIREIVDTRNSKLFPSGVPDNSILGIIGKDLATRFGVVGFIFNSEEILLKNIFCIYRAKEQKRTLSRQEEQVFYNVKMSLIAMKHGFRRY